MAQKQKKYHPAPVKPIIGGRSLEILDRWLMQSGQKGCRLFILADDHTLPSCLPRFVGEVSMAQQAEIIEIPSGEDSKSLNICEGIWLSLAESGADRQSILINLGGGVVTDIGGFAASVFKRGIRSVNVPTSLMAMADAGFGGKTGINLGGAKNQIGTFTQPSGVYCDPEFLSTLPEKHYRSGFAEVIKAALISDPEFWEKVKNHPKEKKASVTGLIRLAAEVKMGVVSADPEEEGVRKVLNFGHTIGHALESASQGKGKNNLLHGEAVAMGMICEAWISHRNAGLDEDMLGEIGDVILHHIPLRKISADPEELIRWLGYDKKNQNGSPRFTLICAPGQTLTDQSAGADLIRESFIYYNSLFE